MYCRRLLRSRQGGHQPEKTLDAQHRTYIHKSLRDFRRFTQLPTRRQHERPGTPCSGAVALQQRQQHRVGGFFLSRQRQGNRLADNEVIGDGRCPRQFIILLRAAKITQ